MPSLMTPGSICIGIWLAWITIWFLAARSAERTKVSESLRSRLFYVAPGLVGGLLISSGTMSGLIPKASFHDSPEIRGLGVILTAFGISYSVWARVHLGRYWSAKITLKEGHRLIQSGPYRWTRHPIYTGLILALVGTAVTVGTVQALLGVLVISISFFFKSLREEALLTGEFRDEYSVYRSKVRALIPFVF